MGRIRAPHGVKGWVRIQPFTRENDGLLDYPDWWLGRNGEWRRHRVVESAVHGAGLIAKLEGCADREAALALKGAEVAIPRSEMPESAPGEYYWSDLLGMEAVNRRGEPLGHVTQLLETGANTVLVLQGDGQVLVPFIDDVIVSVDVENRRLVADWELDY